MPRESKLVREKREAREAAEAEAARVAAQVEETDTEQPQINAVVVVRQETPEGGIVWSVGEILGSVTVDQVSTGLRLAAKRVDETLLGQTPG